ncbi:hypothetical protein ACQUW6_30615 [Bacillus thuringiensis]
MNKRETRIRILDLQDQHCMGAITIIVCAHIVLMIVGLEKKYIN